MTRVVSVSPNAIEADSRTYKFAASAARLGYDAVVVESEPSRISGEALPFELISPGQEPGTHDVDVASRRSRPAKAAAAVGTSRGLGAERIVERLRDWLAMVLFALRYHWQWNRQTSELLPDADVYWLHSYGQFPAVYLKARRVGARFLYDAPDANWGPGIIKGTRSRMVARAYEALERAGARRAERFTTVSDGVAGLLEARFGRRPEVVRNSHDRRLDAEPETDVRTATGVKPDDFLLVMSGHLKPGTAVEEGLAALGELPGHVHLAFLGRSDAVSERTVEAIERTDRAHLLDPVLPEQVTGFIRSADASPILYRADDPNYLYALPNGFFHALSAGLPILFPPLPEIESLATKHELGIEIEPSDPNSIAAGVRALLDDPEAAARYRANSERAGEEINWESEEALIADILASSRLRR